MARLPLLIFLSIVSPTCIAAEGLGFLEQIAVETFTHMREVERYQLKIAEKHYLSKEFKIALDEYDKFLTLYEKSAAAPYAQLMWSHCQVKLRKVNSAIREGFQSVIDYWPESTEAVMSKFLIARCYRDIGEIEKAEPAYAKVISEHENDFLATLSRLDLLEMARGRKQEDRVVALLTDIATKTKSTEQTKNHILGATKELAQHEMSAGNLEASRKWLERICKETELLGNISDLASQHIGPLTKNEKTHTRGIALADGVIALLKNSLAPDLADTKQRDAARACYSRIAAHYNQSGRPNLALETYQTIGKIFGEDDSYLGQLAEWHLRRKESDKARALYAKFQNVVVGLTKIAKTWHEEKRYDKELEVCRQLMVRDKANELAHLGKIAVLWGELKEYAKAVETYRDLMSRDKDKANVYLGKIASLWRSIKEYEKAIETYRELIVKDADHTGDHLWAIAECYEESARAKLAIQAYRQADRFPASHFAMARCHRKLKEFNEAVALYFQAKAHAESAPSAAIEIGYTWEEADKRDNAIKAFQQTCKGFPKSPQASQAHAHLQDKYKITVTLGGEKDE